MTKKKKHYINNERFLQEIKAHYAKIAEAEEQGLPKPKLPDYIGQCFLMICDRLAYRPNFINYSFRDELVGDALENCIIAAEKFDPEKSSNPFAYFTQIAWYAFLRRIAQEKKQQYIKFKNYHNSIATDLALEGFQLDLQMTNSSNTIAYDIIEEFEKKNTTQKVVVKGPKKQVGLEKFMEDNNEEGAPTPSTSSSD